MLRIEKRNRFYFLVFLVLILSVFIFIISLFFKSSIVLDKKEIPISLSIGIKTGFNVTNTSISFGIISKGNSATREDITIVNNYDFPIVLEINVEGNVKEFMVYDSVVYFEPRESKNLIFSTVKISNETYGDYTGKAVILFKRVIPKQS